MMLSTRSIQPLKTRDGEVEADLEPPA